MTTPSRLKAKVLYYVNVNHSHIGNICVVFNGTQVVRADLTGHAPRYPGPRSLADIFPGAKSIERGTSTHEYRAHQIAQSIGRTVGQRALNQMSIELHGTEFQKRVWAELRRVPIGTTITYKELAIDMGLGPNYARAVGSAVARNPIAIVIPCHRVNSKSRTFRWGYDIKTKLLQAENIAATAVVEKMFVSTNHTDHK